MAIVPVLHAEGSFGCGGGRCGSRELLIQATTVNAGDIGTPENAVKR